MKINRLEIVNYAALKECMILLRSDNYFSKKNGDTVKIGCHDFYRKSRQAKPLSTIFPNTRIRLQRYDT